MMITVLILQSNSKYENPGFPGITYYDKRANKAVWSKSSHHWFTLALYTDVYLNIQCLFFNVWYLFDTEMETSSIRKKKTLKLKLCSSLLEVKHYAALILN